MPKKITAKDRAKIINSAIREFKSELEPGEFKEMDERDLYGIESDIDTILLDEYGYKGDEDNYELILERYIFDAIRKMQKGKRHQCDPLYDDAFRGYDGF